MISKLLQRPWIIAAFAGLVAGGALAVLYVIASGPVHAVPEPPPVLSRLKPADVPKRIPSVVFSDAKGGLHALSEYRGRYVLLNLWATWCAPCVRELPALASLKTKLGPADVDVIAVNVGRSTVAETQAFLSEHHAAGLAVYIDANIALVRAFNAYGLPLTVLIDPQGREVARALGPLKWDRPASVEYFRTLSQRPHAAS